jgi:hypothetical protein
MTTGAVSAVSIIQSNYGEGNLEWVARKEGELYWGNRDASSFQWSGPYAFSAQPCCDPRLAGKWSDEISGSTVGGDTFMFTPSRGASDTGPDSPAFEPVDLYPFVYALPDGNVFVHSRTTSRILSNPDKLDPNNLTSTWSAPFHTVSLVPRTYPSAVPFLRRGAPEHRQRRTQLFGVEPELDSHSRFWGFELSNYLCHIDSTRRDDPRREHGPALHRPQHHRSSELDAADGRFSSETRSRPARILHVVRARVLADGVPSKAQIIQLK